MINMNFWKRIKEKWIRDEDPTIEATKDSIQKDTRSAIEINELNQRLNGSTNSINGVDTLGNLNRMMEQLNDLGIDDDPFGDLLLDLGNEE